MTIKEVSEKYNVSQDTLRYYERMKMIPKVHRTSGGIRDYRAEDLHWVELALCMRSAARLELLNEQMEALRAQKAQLEDTMNRLAYKIERYEDALRTGKLVWGTEEEH